MRNSGLDKWSRWYYCDKCSFRTLSTDEAIKHEDKRATDKGEYKHLMNRKKLR